MHSIQTTVERTMHQAENEGRTALQEQGFGVLTEIDVAVTFKPEFGIERTPLKTVGVCTPQFAHEALQADPSAALLLPCNVVLEPAGPAPESRWSIRVSS